MKNIGIWLDQKEAMIVTLYENTASTKMIYSEIETRERIPGESKIYGRFGDQFLNDEKNKENRINELTTKYLNNIVDQLKKVDEILLFGPAQIKTKLEKLIQKNHVLAAKLKSVQNANNMTDNQKVAYVKEYFKH